MRYAGAALAITFVSAVQLYACSSSKEVTSLDSDKTLSSLTTEERRQLCEDRFHFLSSRISADDRRKIRCADSATGIGSGGESNTERSRSACRAVYRACMSVPASEPQSACDTFPKEADGCMATVGEVSACSEERADALEDLASRADDACKTPGQSPRLERGHRAKSQDACARVQRLCPKLSEEKSER